MYKLNKTPEPITGNMQASFTVIVSYSFCDESLLKSTLSESFDSF